MINVNERVAEIRKLWSAKKFQRRCVDCKVGFYGIGRDACLSFEVSDLLPKFLFHSLFVFAALVVGTFSL